MRNKGAVVILTVIVTLLCLYYLSFTLVSRNIQNDAIEYATEENGVVNSFKKQAYLDSLWNVPVYSLFGAEFTYKDVKDNELSLGLDLQGGMHVVLEVSPIEIVKGLAGNSQDPDFLAALEKAKKEAKTSSEKFTSIFYKAFKAQNPEAKLAPIYANVSNKDRFSFTSSDEEILAVLDAEIEQSIERSLTILRTRIDQFGTSQPNIQRLQGTGRIQVEVPGADNPTRIRKLLQGAAKLGFWEVIELNELNSSLMAINTFLVEEKARKSPLASESLKSELQGEEQEEGTESDLEAQLGADSSEGSNLDSLTNTGVSPIFALSKGQGMLAYSIRDTAAINRVLNRREVKSKLPRNVKYFWDAKASRDYAQGNEELFQLYFVRVPRNGKAILEGDVIADARQDLDPRNASPMVTMRMNPAGSRIWKNMTAEAALTKARVAIVLDNAVVSAPSVQGEIPNGNSQIVGNFTIDEAKDLANILKAGSLPAPTKIVEEAIVGPTLGKVAQRQGAISIVSGLVIVVLFMVAYYAKGGFVANIALVFNIFFILGILAQLKSALTLPGIAGMVLTIGMAIDANVLIFERIREELLNGAKLKEAISLGYKKSFSSIFDSNVTTMLTAIILYVLGQGPIKGFAITLMIGIACSFFSAVYITRVVVEWITRKGEASKVSFTTPISTSILKMKELDFLSKRKVAYMTSVAVIVVGMVIIGFQGLNLGVDFKGGRSYTVSFQNPVVATDMKLALTKSFDNKSTEVKNFGANNIVKVTTAFLREDDSDEADEEVKGALVNGLKEFSGLEFSPDDSKINDGTFTISSSSKVSPTISEDIKATSWEAGIIALLAIFLYILLRFRRWQFSAGAIVAVIHDALFVFAAFAIAGALGITYEIDQVFVAALLTVIGYSINDTVIVFDRIREYLSIGTSTDNLKVYNSAINGTLSRTLITSGTTLLVVLILFIFGGEVLRGFSFALLVGVIVGTYSSIYIATPVVVDLDRRGLLKSPKPEEPKK
jgi:SecD/SecF fusion protein